MTAVSAKCSNCHDAWGSSAADCFTTEARDLLVMAMVIRISPHRVGHAPEQGVHPFNGPAQDRRVCNESFNDLRLASNLGGEALWLAGDHAHDKLRGQQFRKNLARDAAGGFCH